MPKWLKKVISAITLMVQLTVSIAAYAKTETIELDGRNTVVMDENMDDLSTHKFMQAILGARISIPPEQMLYVVISSNGGNYKSALTLEGVLENTSSNSNITIICKYCASSAGYVFATFKGTKLVIKSSRVLMHEMVLLRVSAVQSMNKPILEDLQVNSDAFNKAMYSHLRISKEEYEKQIIGKEWNLYGEDIVKHHLADKLVNIHCNHYLEGVIPHTCANDDNAD